MKMYFYDEDNRYVGNRALSDGEVMPIMATAEIADVGDGQEAYFVDGKWVVSQIPIEPTYTD